MDLVIWDVTRRKSGDPSDIMARWKIPYKYFKVFKGKS